MFTRELDKKSASKLLRGSLSATGHAPACGHAKGASAPEKRTPAHPFTRPEQLSDLLTGRGAWAPDGGHHLAGLHSLLGNQQMQSLLGRHGMTPGAAPCTCGGSCSHCSGDDHDLAGLTPRTGPLPEIDPEEEKKTGLSPLVPIDASKAGGAIACVGGLMTVWVNPTVPACLVPCVTQHEQKHISDFLADPNYKDACKGVPDGETFTYRNNDDARKFEHAASDVEIACLAAAIPGEKDPNCKALMTTRKDKTLPDYKKSFDGC